MHGAGPLLRCSGCLQLLRGIFPWWMEVLSANGSLGWRECLSVRSSQSHFPGESDLITLIPPPPRTISILATFFLFLRTLESFSGSRDPSYIWCYNCKSHLTNELREEAPGECATQLFLLYQRLPNVIPPWLVMPNQLIRSRGQDGGSQILHLKRHALDRMFGCLKCTY